MEFKTAKITNKGSRDVNEDFCGYYINKKSYCCIVADGLGGHGSGEVASRTAVNSILESFKEKVYALENAENYLKEAQDELIRIQNSNIKYKAMRTTLNLLLIEENEALWAHIGDSRLYYFKDNIMKLRTKDHSVPQMLANAGEISEKEIRFHEDRNRLLRALGDPDSFKPQIGNLTEIDKGDKFLICTDGFWEYVYEDEMEQALKLSNSPDEWLDLMGKILISHKNQDNDNYTAVAVFIV
ncbi:MAG: PP2C family serine/threonine-protein phosphatase [Clostridiaceae bacterium]